MTLESKKYQICPRVEKGKRVHEFLLPGQKGREEKGEAEWKTCSVEKAMIRKMSN